MAPVLRACLGKGYAVHGTSRDAARAQLDGLNALGIAGQVKLHSMSPADFGSVAQVIGAVAPDEIYNLSGQSSVSLSFSQPADTLTSIALGTLNLLEMLRRLGRQARFYNAGSSECFGETGSAAANEQTAFHPKSPYGVAKAAAILLTTNYRESYDQARPVEQVGAIVQRVRRRAPFRRTRRRASQGSAARRGRA
jgi:GDPmannose 4,6-dehydratase